MTDLQTTRTSLLRYSGNSLLATKCQPASKAASQAHSSAHTRKPRLSHPGRPDDKPGALFRAAFNHRQFLPTTDLRGFPCPAKQSPPPHHDREGHRSVIVLPASLCGNNNCNKPACSLLVGTEPGWGRHIRRSSLQPCDLDRHHCAAPSSKCGSWDIFSAR